MPVDAAVSPRPLFSFSAGLAVWKARLEHKEFLSRSGIPKGCTHCFDEGIIAIPALEWLKQKSKSWHGCKSCSADGEASSRLQLPLLRHDGRDAREIANF